jgi:hypothetical protein
MKHDQLLKHILYKDQASRTKTKYQELSTAADTLTSVAETLSAHGLTGSAIDTRFIAIDVREEAIKLLDVWGEYNVRASLTEPIANDITDLDEYEAMLGHEIDMLDEGFITALDRDHVLADVIEEENEEEEGFTAMCVRCGMQVVSIDLKEIDEVLDEHECIDRDGIVAEDEDSILL